MLHTDCKPHHARRRRPRLLEGDRLAGDLVVASGSIDARLALLRAAALSYGAAIARGYVTADDARVELRSAAASLVDEIGDDAVQAAIADGMAAGDRDARLGRAVAHRGILMPIVHCAADIVPEPVRWVWPGHFALGKMGLLAGQPGDAKSQLACLMTATVTTGGLWPDGSRAPQGSAVMIGCEDGYGDTVVPRLMAAGADRSRVHILDWAIDTKTGGRQHFDVHGHIDQLAALVQRIGDVRLIVIDPITAYMGRADTHRTADVRGALAPLQTMAAEHGVAVLLISHLTKGGDRPAMDRVTGSGAYVALSRSAWLTGRDPRDDTRERRVLASIRCSLAAEPPSLAYTVEPVTLPGGIVTSRVVIDPTPVTITADELVQSRSGAAPPSELDEARAFLEITLAPGPQLTADVKRGAAAAGIAWRTVERARSALGVVPRKDGEGGAWRMHLPTRV